MEPTHMPAGVVPTNLEVNALVADSLNAYFSDPTLFIDQWDLEPLTPLSSPFQSPTIPPHCGSPILPDVPALDPSSSVPTVQCPSRVIPSAPDLPTAPPLSATPLPPHPGRTRAKEGKTKRRRNKRKATATPFSRKLKSSTSTHVAGTGMMKNSAKAEALPIARGAYVGVRQEPEEQVYWTLDKLRAKGFRIKKWDGRSRFVIVDQNGRIIALFAGRPDDAHDWDEVADRATTAMEQARDQCHFTRDQMEHHRGDYATLGCGSSFGGGSTSPGNISNTKRNAKALAQLCRNPDLRRIAGFGSFMLASYAPRVHLKMKRRLRLLYERHPDLKINFDNSIYPAAHFNFGPRSVCFKHTDFANDPVNWCHITALGRYNPTEGGHVILFNLRLVVEFPPSASILIPSAIVPHGNVPIQHGEVRLSFTQYCPGGLLRWVDAGFQTLKTFEKLDPTAKAEFDAHLDERTRSCVNYFSRWDELLADLQEAGKPVPEFPDLPDL